jgi:A/G-specific adenine glycosylase
MKKTNLLNKNVVFFRQKLISWDTHQNKRKMPWKGIKDVYKIWLSEVILQQTRVEQGTSYYHRFIETYPTIFELAKADETKVLKLWEGLGYYSRCKNLHATAKHIAFERKGKFPESYDELIQLKGVGAYTAAAMASFAYNLPHAVIDGNVIRVISRFWGVKEPADSAEGKKILHQLAQESLDKQDPAKYNQAIMDFGATVCKPMNPDCTSCLLQKNCFAYQNNCTDQLPLFEKKIKKKSRWFIYHILKLKNKIAVQQRQKGDIWAGLYDFPSTELRTKNEWLHYSADKKTYTQQLTHQRIYAKTIQVELKHKNEFPNPVQWKNMNELSQLPYPKLVKDIIKEMF